MICLSCAHKLVSRPDGACESHSHWKSWSELLETKFKAKVDYARERFDDIESILERWRARDGSPRSGDAPAAHQDER